MPLNKLKIKEKLEKERDMLLEQMKDMGKMNPKTGEWEATPENSTFKETDQNDMADRFEDFESKSSMIEVLEERLRSIMNALRAINKETFGTCKICGKQIEALRLEANPAARTCKKHMQNSSTTK
jgi:RNA polymerase-binding transcription factor DksA